MKDIDLILVFESIDDLHYDRVLQSIEETIVQSQLYKAEMRCIMEKMFSDFFDRIYMKINQHSNKIFN